MITLAWVDLLVLCSAPFSLPFRRISCDLSSTPPMPHTGRDCDRLARPLIHCSSLLGMRPRTVVRGSSVRRTAPPESCCVPLWSVVVEKARISHPVTHRRGSYFVQCAIAGPSTCVVGLGWIDKHSDQVDRGSCTASSETLCASATDQGMGVC